MTDTEYEFREINADGDAIDISHFETRREAINAAKTHVANGGVAAVVEKHVCRRPAHLFGEPDTYTTLATFGDKSALKLGGWVPGDCTWLES